MIDTHCHLSDKRFDKDREQVLDRARHAGVHALRRDRLRARDRASGRTRSRAEHPNVFLCVGVHPSESAQGARSSTSPTLRDHARHARVVAIGETGLDFYRDYAPRADQERWFRAQLALADELGLPVVIHQRSALDETLAHPRGDARRRRAACCIASTTARQAVERARALGFKLGLGGVPHLRARARSTRRCATAPAGHAGARDRRALPRARAALAPAQRAGAAARAWCAASASCAAGRPEEAVRITTANARELFRLPIDVAGPARRSGLQAARPAGPITPYHDHPSTGPPRRDPLGPARRRSSPSGAGWALRALRRRERRAARRRRVADVALALRELPRAAARRPPPWRRRPGDAEPGAFWSAVEDADHARTGLARPVARAGRLPAPPARAPRAARRVAAGAASWPRAGWDCSTRRPRAGRCAPPSRGPRAGDRRGRPRAGALPRPGGAATGCWRIPRRWRVARTARAWRCCAPSAAAALPRHGRRARARHRRDARWTARSSRRSGWRATPPPAARSSAGCASGDVEQRVAAARALGRMEATDCAVSLVGALQDEAWPVRAQAARALGRLRAELALLALPARLTDPAWWVRRHAAYALREFGPEGRRELERIAARLARPLRARDGPARSSTAGPTSPERRAGAAAQAARGLKTRTGRPSRSARRTGAGAASRARSRCAARAGTSPPRGRSACRRRTRRGELARDLAHSRSSSATASVPSAIR